MIPRVLWTDQARVDPFQKMPLLEAAISFELSVCQITFWIGAECGVSVSLLQVVMWESTWDARKGLWDFHHAQTGN